MRFRFVLAIVLPALWFQGAGSVRAQGLAGGIQLLKGMGNDQVGETALAALALVKAGVPSGNPDVARLLGKVSTRFSEGGYLPERTGGMEVYEVGVVSMLLSALNDTSLRPQIQSVAAYLTAAQKANGSWDYSHRQNGDTSISQYAVLGLWEAEVSGVRVSPAVWEKAAKWFLSTQAAGGSWSYHRDESGPETISMTAAGVGSLLICQRQLAPYRKVRDASRESGLLRPLNPDPIADYKVGIADQQLNDAINRGIDWLGRNMNFAQAAHVGQSPFYGLYGIERVGSLSGKKMLGQVDWYSFGSQYLSGHQTGGGWSAHYGPICNTAWAVMFLSRATEKSVAKATMERLGSGTLLGGRGLPTDLSKLSVAQGRVVVRPMSGAIDEMLDVLEDPRAQAADTALAGIVDRYRIEGPRGLRPLKDRFRKLIVMKDPGLRMTGLWALARTGDLDVMPDLINALSDADEEVVATAVFGLKLVTRKVDGFGPEPGATPEQKKAAAEKWNAWYQSARPADLADQHEPS